MASGRMLGGLGGLSRDEVSVVSRKCTSGLEGGWWCLAVSAAGFASEVVDGDGGRGGWELGRELGRGVVVWSMVVEGWKVV